MNPAPLVESGHIRLKQCRVGPLVYLHNDQYIGRSVDHYGEFSEGESDLFRQIIRPGWTVMDIGANLGVHTIYMAKIVGPQGSVHAFEPQRVLFQILCANVALNALSNVYTHQAAAGRTAGEITVPRLDYASGLNFGGISLGTWEHGEKVPQLTVDAMNLPHCHFMKIDVEGMESEAIAGAEQTIRRCQPVLYIENDRKDKSAPLIQQLFDLNYRLYWHLPPMYSAANFFGNPENIFGNVVSVNMLCLPRTVGQNISGLKEVLTPNDDWQRM